jgi:hypothetical protein
VSGDGRWQAVPLDDVEGYADEGRPRWHMIRTALGVEAFGVNAWSATAAGQDLIGEHDELGRGAGRHEELYVVVSGHATFTVDDEAVEAPARTMLFVKDPAVRRSAVARDAGTTVLVIGARPAQPFTPSDWERSAEALRYWSTQEWDRAIAVLRSQHEEHPENAGVLYNLACAEARGGYADDALMHLALAVAMEARFAETARADPDLAGVRGDPRFPS